MKKVFKSLVVVAIILLSGIQLSAQKDSCTAEISWQEEQSFFVSMFVFGDIDSTDNVLWEFGDGTTGTGVYTTHMYNDFGTYQVIATIDGACGAFSTTTQIYFDTIQNPTDCSLDFYYEQTGVENEYMFYAYGVGFDETDTYNWFFGDNIPLVGQEVIYSFPAEGEYFVTLTSENDECGEMSVTYPVYVYNDSTSECYASYWYMLDSVDLNTVYFFDNSYFEGNATYMWDFGDGETSVLSNPMHTYTEAGQYFVSLAIDANGCRSIYQDYVWVGDDNWYPEECQALFYADYSYEGYSVDFVDISYTDGQPVTAWAWSFGDGTGSDIQNPTHEYNAVGEYLVTLTIFTQGCTSTFEEMIYVEENSYNGDCQAFFYPMFDGTLSVEFFDLSMPTPDTWAWDFGDGTTSSLQNPVYSFSQPGEYTVTLFTTAGDSCQSAFAMDIYLYEDTIGNGKDVSYIGEITQAHAVQVSPTAINRVTGDVNISIYPNPVADVLNVNFGHITNNATVRILNVNGQVLYNQVIDNQNVSTVNVADFNNGIYILQVIENSQIKSVKFIK